jgi:osmotically-inducible protein OsmY
MGKLQDIETTAKIRIALMAEPRVGGLEIGLNTINGIVFMTGHVQDPEQKALAEEIASKNGALDIKNDIDVLSQQPVEDQAAFRVVDFASEPSIDQMIRDRVIGDLDGDSRLSASGISVEVIGGIVHLAGYQIDEDGPRLAEQVASRVPGVRLVVNDIRIARAA